MLTTIRSASGQILGCCEWWMINDQCNQDWTWGTHVWVEQLELSPDAGPEVIRQLIQRIATFVPGAKDAYWVRRDKTAIKVHAFSRNTLTRIRDASFSYS